MKKYKLGELGEVRMCKRILKEDTNTVSGIPFFKIGTFGNVADVFITRKKFEEYKAKYSYPKKGDVLISAAGTIGRTVVYNGEDAYFQDSNIVWIENDESKVVNALLYYAYKNVKWKVSNGSTILRLYNDDLRRTEIFVPADISVQKKIASILSSLDKRIENLRAQNRVLEQTAKTIYDYTFLQCAGHQTTYNKTLNRNIPADWEVKKLKEVCKVLLGGTPNTKREDYWLNGTINWLNSGEVANFPIIDCEKKITKKAVEESSTVFLPKGSVTLSITRYLRPSILAIDACINQSVAGILENGILKKSYLFPMLKTEVPKLNALRSGAQQPHINKDIVENINVVIPPKEVLDKYYSIVDPIYEKILINSEHLKELVNQRNTLLPLLMTGQIEV